MKTLPTAADLPAEQLARRFFRVEEARPYGNEDLGYSLLLEKTWQLDPVRSSSPQLDTVALKPLGLFRGPQAGGANPYVLVQAIRLEREITAADWLAHVSRETGWDLAELRPAGPEFCDSLVEAEVEGRPFWGRAAARFDGDRAFLVLALGPDRLFEVLAPTYGAAVTSFRPLRPARRPTIEERVPYDVGDAIGFSFPASWSAREAENAALRKSAVDLFNLVGDELHGLVRVKVARSSTGATIEEEMAASREELAEAGAEVGALREQHRPSLGGPRFRDALLRVHDATIPGNPGPVEAWTCAIDARPHVVTVTLLVPDRDSEFVSWAVGRRAFEIALETLR